MPVSQPDRTLSHDLAEDSSIDDSGAGRGDPSGSGAGASLDQFRQVLEDQRRQTAQLQSLLEARFAGDAAGGGAADKVESLVSKIETLASRLDSIGTGGNGHGGSEKPVLPPQVNGLMLRVGELERKISEATPEPLLKEIVFRLGSLEDAVGQSPDSGGIGEIRERVKALERQKGDRSSPDPRIDELAARLDELSGRLHSLQDQPAAAAPAARVAELQEQIESLRAAAGGANRDALKDLEERIAAIENSTPEPGGGADSALLAGLGAKIESLDGLAERLESLESRVAGFDGEYDSKRWASRLEAIESWGVRLTALEEKASTSDPRIAEIAARLTKLDSIDSFSERLSTLEEQASVPPGDPRVDEIESKISSLAAWTERLAAVESKAAEPPADPRFDGIESRLHSLETIAERLAGLEAKLAEPPADPRVDEISARLGAMADVARIGDVESRVSSLNTRLDALKMITDGLKAAHRPGSAEAGSRMDALAAQIDELKTLLAARDEAIEAANPPAWDELLRRVEVLEKEGGPAAHDPRFTELAARLASLEKSGAGGADPRVTEILARLNNLEQPKSGPAAAPIPPDLIDRIDALEKRLSGAPAKGTDPIVAQLRERWEILEERMIRFEESLPASGYGESEHVSGELRSEVAELRAKVDALGTGESAAGLDSESVAALRELAKNPPSTGGAFDLGNIKSQMTFVYFSIGMLYAICAYAGYVMLSSH